MLRYASGAPAQIMRIIAAALAARGYSTAGSVAHTITVRNANAGRPYRVGRHQIHTYFLRPHPRPTTLRDLLELLAPDLSREPGSPTLDACVAPWRSRRDVASASCPCAVTQRWLNSALRLADDTSALVPGANGILDSYNLGKYMLRPALQHFVAGRLRWLLRLPLPREYSSDWYGLEDCGLAEYIGFVAPLMRRSVGELLPARIDGDDCLERAWRDLAPIVSPADWQLIQQVILARLPPNVRRSAQTRLLSGQYLEWCDSRGWRLDLRRTILREPEDWSADYVILRDKYALLERPTRS